MTEAGIGRLLVASLHQAIGDILPRRLEFYENWLSPSGLRDGTIGLAPLAAVLSFLRLEGESYALITARAGEYAAEWAFAALPAIERSLVRALPPPLRARAALQVGRRVIRQTYGGSRAIVRWRRGAGTVEVRGSIFCAVRMPMQQPLCGYYATVLMRLLLLFGLDSDARVSQCRGVGEKTCLVGVAIHGARAQNEQGVAA